MTFDSSDFIIRKARMSDRNHLRAMQIDSLRTLAARCYTREEIEAFITFVGTMDDRLIADSTYFVVEAKGRLLASGGWSRQAASHAAGLPADPTAAKVRNLFVHRDWARHGLGRSLVERIELEALYAGFDRMELNTPLSGASFWRALGYQATRPIELNMPDGIRFRGLSMSKSLVDEAAPALGDDAVPLPPTARGTGDATCCLRQAA